MIRELLSVAFGELLSVAFGAGIFGYLIGYYVGDGIATKRTEKFYLDRYRDWIPKSKLFFVKAEEGYFCHQCKGYHKVPHV